MPDNRVSGDRQRSALPAGVVPEPPGGVDIFHYTSPRGLLNVVENKVLWATEATGMNDLAEVRQGWDFILNWLGDHDRSDSVIDSMLDVAQPDLKNSRVHPLRATDGIYMCCASEREDDANQWRLYAAGGRGYAIQLDPRVPLTTALAKKPILDRQRPAKGLALDFTEIYEQVAVSRWQKVLYTDVEKDLALARLVAESRDEYARIDKRAANEDDWREQRQIADAEMLGHLAQLAQLMKSVGFSGESEYRLIISDWFDRHQNFRETPNGVVRYAQLTQNQLEPKSHRIAYLDDEVTRNGLTLPITSVWLGPLIHTANNRATVEALLATNGFGGCRVRDSQVPLGH